MKPMSNITRKIRTRGKVLFWFTKFKKTDKVKVKKAIGIHKKDSTDGPGRYVSVESEDYMV